MGTGIIIYTKSHFTKEPIESLAEAIDKSISADITIVDADRSRLGVTWWEVVIIFILAEVSKKIIGEVTDAAINWAKQRLIDENSSRPKFISIFGPEGVPINAKLITPGNVEDKTGQSSARFLLEEIQRDLESKNFPTPAAEMNPKSVKRNVPDTAISFVSVRGMKHVKECPICFEPRASCSGEYECSKHGIPYDTLGEWVNEQVQDVEECYQDQIPVRQPLFQDASDFGARVQDSGRMNERLKHTIAFLTEVQKELGSYHLRILGLLSNGLELTQADGEWCIQTPDGKVWRCAEEEIQPLRELRYIQGARITELGREALRIYKMAHPLLLYDIDQI